MLLNSGSDRTPSQFQSQSGPYICERINPLTGKPCNTIFSRPYDLTRHEDTIHKSRKQKLKCSHCTDEKIFARVDALTRHMRLVHPEIDLAENRRRQRRDTGKSTADQSLASLAEPIAGSSNPLPQDKAAETTSLSLNGTDDPPYPPRKRPRIHVCATCKKSFSQKTHLMIHERTHEKSQDLVCSECSLRFSKLGDLRQHQNDVHGTNSTRENPPPRTNTDSPSFVIPYLPQSELGSRVFGRSEASYGQPSPSFFTWPLNGTGSPTSIRSPSNSPASAASAGAATPEPIRFSVESPPRRNTLPSQVPQSYPWRDNSFGGYEYQMLQPNHFRLLRLAQDALDGQLRLSVQVVSLQELEDRKFEYYALSYAWGTESASRTILMRDEPEAERETQSQTWPHLNRHEYKSFSVRPNLFAALTQLRTASEDVLLWIDALCINQQDASEKAHQLPSMLAIYSNACSVCIWLGSPGPPHRGTEQPSDPLDFIHFIVNLKLVDRWIEDDHPDEEILRAFVGFADLLRQPWFSRRWVIQEVAACRQASVHYGDKKINWIDFVDAVQLFLAHIDQIRAAFSRSRLHVTNPDALSHIESTGAVALVNAASNLLRKNAKGNIIARLLDIESLVMTFQHFEVSDPRDVIYALLPLANDETAPSRGVGERDFGFLTDYTKCAHELFIEFVLYVIRTSKSLGILCRHWAPQIEFGQCKKGACFPSDRCRIPELPSWVGLAMNSAFGPPSLMTGRLNGDEFVGHVGNQQYKASQSEAPSFQLAVDLTGVRTTLVVKGFVLGLTTKVSSRIVDGIIPAECFQMAGWNRTMDINEIPDRLWRTLVADRTATGTKAPSWWRRACMHCLTKMDFNGDLNTSKVISSRSLPNIVTNDYLKRVQAVMWNRKFFLCQNAFDHEIMLGLGPRSMEQGDYICILYGCIVPVVLRKLIHGGIPRYSLVGECFVFEKMDGEAMAGMNQVALEAITVNFRLM